MEGHKIQAKKYFLTVVAGIGGYQRRKREASVVRDGVRRCLRTDETEFNDKGILKLPQLWQKEIDRDGSFVDKQMIRQTRCFPTHIFMLL
jgi:hypothetical protein